MNLDLPQQLSDRLAKPLPGQRAQSRFAPQLAYGRHAGPAAFDARGAAVVVLLYPHNDCWTIPLTLRPDHLPTHAGQISLPGGLIAQGESSQDAALRELNEELGVPTAAVRMLGRLSDLYMFNSNHLVNVWMATTDRRPEFVLCENEVAELIEVPLAHLADRDNTIVQRRNHGGLVFRAPAFCWGDHRIWGATSMMLSELLAVVEGLPV